MRFSNSPTASSASLPANEEPLVEDGDDEALESFLGGVEVGSLSAEEVAPFEDEASEDSLFLTSSGGGGGGRSCEALEAESYPSGGGGGRGRSSSEVGAGDASEVPAISAPGPSITSLSVFSK